jgi:hypothetical protein
MKKNKPKTKKTTRNQEENWYNQTYTKMKSAVLPVQSENMPGERG